MPLAGQFHANFRTPILKPDSRRPKMAYKQLDAGLQPVMAAIHVRFIEMCVPTRETLHQFPRICWMNGMPATLQSGNIF